MAVKLRLRNGKYWLYIHHNRRRRAKCVGTDKRLAENARKRVEAQLALGALGITEQHAQRPFAAYFRTWLDTYARTHCKESTCAEYDSAYRVHLLPHFGERDIADITRDDVKALAYALLAKGRARATVRAVLAPLREMYSHAIEDGHVSANPATRVLKRSRFDAGARRVAGFLTREELARLLVTCREHFARYYPFVLLLARTGMRLGEAPRTPVGRHRLARSVRGSAAVHLAWQRDRAQERQEPARGPERPTRRDAAGAAPCLAEARPARRPGRATAVCVRRRRRNTPRRRQLPAPSVAAPAREGRAAARTHPRPAALCRAPDYAEESSFRVDSMGKFARRCLKDSA